MTDAPTLDPAGALFDALDEIGADPAAESASADPLPGTGRRPRRGRPPGSKNKPQSQAALDARRANMAKLNAKQRAARTGPTDAQLRDAVAGVYATLGLGLGWIDPAMGQAVASCAESAAEAWIHVGQQSPAVRRVLVQLTTAGAAGELIAAHAPLIVLAMARVNASRAVPDAGPLDEPLPPWATAAASNGAPWVPS